MNIPIIINNYNLLTWPKKMVEIIKTWDNVGDIIIFDNCSTYKPLLDWYKTNPCEIIYSKHNLGHSGPWDAGIPQKKGYEYYVVTDPDLGLEDVPKDCLSVLLEKMQKYPQYDRIGISIIDFVDRTVGIPGYYYEWLDHIRQEFWNESGKEDGLLKFHLIDTTFALYNINRNKSGTSCALDFPYSMRHLPWQINLEDLKNLDKTNPEYFNYLKTAGDSSSYKRFSDFKTYFKNKI